MQPLDTATITDASTYEPFTSAAAGARDRWVRMANSAWLRYTGLAFGSVAADDEPLVEDAVRGLAELNALAQSDERQETLGDFDLLKSFSASSYSEQRRSPDEMVKARMLVPWAWVNSALWDFMTPEKRAYWLEFFGGNAPAVAVTEVDWARESFIYPDDLYYGGF